MKYLSLLAVSVLILSSCVPNRKYVYLQKEDVNKKDLPRDTVVRSYDLEPFEYRIQPEDILYVRFESLTPQEFDFLANQTQPSGQALNQNINPQLIGELVDMDGNIPFPVIGKVKVAGLTVYQAQDTLQSIADRYLESPIVKVRLINLRITILGEVKSEGTITLQNNRVSLIEAIGHSGGLTDLADKRNVKLIRVDNGKTTVQYINLLDEEFMNSSTYFVHQNDVLIVPALRQRPYRRYFGQNLSLIISTLSLVLLTINLTR